MNQKNHSTLQQPLRQTLSPERFINLDEVERLTGFKSSYLYTNIQKGTFPKPVKIGTASRWQESEVQAWIRQQVHNNLSSNQ